MVMVIRLGLSRSLPRYLYSSSGPVRRERRRASNLGKEEPSLARPLFVALSLRDYGMILFRHLWRWVWGVGVRPRRVRPVPSYPGSGRGRPASVRSSPILAVLTTHTLPTIIACAN